MATLQKRLLPLIGWRTSLFANVAFRLLARVSPRGRTQCRCCRNAPSAQCPLRCLFSPLGGVDSSGAKTEPTVAKQYRRPTSLPSSVSVPSAAKNATGRRSEKPHQGRCCVPKIGSFPYVHSTPAGKLPKRHCQRGPRPPWFATTGFSAARQVDYGGAKTEPSQLK